MARILMITLIHCLLLLRWSTMLEASDDDPVDRRMIHVPGVERVAACAFSPMPRGLNASAILADLLPRLTANELSYGTFGDTRSVKWRFSAIPGALEASMDPATATWARPLVDAWSRRDSGKAGADMFLLNGLSVPCGAGVAAHYDDTIATEHTPLRVSVLYLATPPEGTWSGGTLRAYQGRGSALRGDPAVCEAEPSLHHAVHFRGNLFHGISELLCEEEVKERGGSRVSVVLEQYDMAHTRRSLSVGVDGTLQELLFDEAHHATSGGRRAAAQAFAVKHGLLGNSHGTEVDEGRSVVDVLAERMDVIVNAQLEARGEAARGGEAAWLTLSRPPPGRGVRRLGRDSASDTRQLAARRSSLPAASSGAGVFATESLEAGAVLCEARGHLLGEGEDLGPRERDRTHPAYGTKVVQGGICSLINDCRNVGAHPGVRLGDQPWEREQGNGEYCWAGFAWNCKLITEPLSGKYFVQALRRIEAGEELFYDYGDDYWFHNDPVNQAADAAVARPAASPGFESSEVSADLVDSGPIGGLSCSAGQAFAGLGEDAGTDLAFLYVAPSSVPSMRPGRNYGVFAARAIAEGAVLCEMRGHYLSAEEEQLAGGTRNGCTVKTKHGTLVAGGVCSLINDCRDVGAFPGVEGGSSSPDSPGRDHLCGPTLSWNAYLTTEIGGKPFVQALRDIAKDEEIFVDYGDDFWFLNPPR